MTMENEEEERAASSQMATDSLWPDHQCIKKKKKCIYTHAYTQANTHTNIIFTEVCHFFILGWSFFFGESMINFIPLL